MKTLLYFLLTSIALSLPSLSPADTIKMSQQADLKTCATATLKAFLVFTVGEASFNASDCGNRMASNVHKKITFAYEREIPANAFSESSLNFLKKNLTPEALDYWKEDITAFNLAYKAVDEGDQYDIEHAPGRGLILYFNDVQIAQNVSDDFAIAYLTIWFGDDPFDKGLKKKLLAE